MKIYCLRHTSPNIAKGVCYGQSDIGVANTFPQDVAKIRKKVAEIQYDSIYSSPLQRCLMLAELLANSEIPVQPDDRLKELDFGRWELESWENIYQDKLSKEWFDNYLETCCPEGESFAQLYDRVASFVSKLRNLPATNVPLIVTHAGVIRALYALSRQADLKEAMSIAVPFGSLHIFVL